METFKLELSCVLYIFLFFRFKFFRVHKNKSVLSMNKLAPPIQSLNPHG